MGDGVGGVEIEIQLEDVYAGLAEKSQIALLRMFRNHCANVLLAHVARASHSPNLKLRGSR